MIQLTQPKNESKEDIALPPEILILHLIATGLIRCKGQIDQGKSMDMEYPIPLQLGLDRLNVQRYRQILPLIKSIPDLLAWCQRPLSNWSLSQTTSIIDPESTLLAGQFTTQLCEDLACSVSDVEADLNERRFMESVFNICKGEQNPQAYIDFRRLLISTSVMTALDLLETREKYPHLDILQELIEAAYEEASLDYMMQGTFSCCPTCGNLQLPDAKRKNFLCEDERCRHIAFTRQRQGKTKRLQARERVYWLRRDLRRFITMPGRAELRLEKKLLELNIPGLTVEMWPEYDSYDLKVVLPVPHKTTKSEHTIIAVDVKDWANPYLLARKVVTKGIPPTPAWHEAYFVFPKERKHLQPDYVRAFTNTCNSYADRTIIGGKTKAAFENDFIKIVKAKCNHIIEDKACAY